MIACGIKSVFRYVLFAPMTATMGAVHTAAAVVRGNSMQLRWIIGVYEVGVTLMKQCIILGFGVGKAGSREFRKQGEPMSHNCVSKFVLSIRNNAVCAPKSYVLDSIGKRTIARDTCYRSDDWRPFRVANYNFTRLTR